MRLAIIPARGASKRIPRKNIKLFGGKPMIAWSIEIALQSGCFDRVLVSTDDFEIAEVAKIYGAEVPFMRPPELSDDHSGTIPVIAHAIQWQNSNGPLATQVCCIFATAPFIQVYDLQRGLELLKTNGVEYACSVTSYSYPIQRAIRITSDQRIEMFHPEHFQTRSQDLDASWHDAGQFCWGHAGAWLANKPVFDKYSIAVHLPRYRVQDIDTEEDWLRAEWMFRALNSQL